MSSVKELGGAELVAEAIELYDHRDQLLKTCEECGELIQAIVKYLLVTSPNFHPNTGDYDPEECRKNILIESIQVELMLDQVEAILPGAEEWRLRRLSVLEYFRVKVARDRTSPRRRDP